MKSQQAGISVIYILIALSVAALVALAATVYLKSQQRNRGEEWDRQRVAVCHDAVATLAKYRSKAKFTQTKIDPRGDRVEVSGIVDMMNAFGAMIPHRYRCVEYRDGIGLVEPPELVAEGA